MAHDLGDEGWCATSLRSADGDPASWGQIPSPAHAEREGSRGRSGAQRLGRLRGRPDARSGGRSVEGRVRMRVGARRQDVCPFERLGASHAHFLRYRFVSYSPSFFTGLYFFL